MATTTHNPTRPLWWVLADAACVLAFVVMGRMNHAEGLTVSGVASTALPFLLALGLAWAIPTVNRQPWSPVAGLIVWVDVVILGMLLRRFLFGDGTALAFVIVATIFFGITFNGWRALARAIPN